MTPLVDSFVKRLRDARRLQAQADALHAFGRRRAADVIHIRADACELVLERVMPGIPLALLATEDEAMRVAADLLADGGWPPASDAIAAESFDLFTLALGDANEPQIARAAAMLRELLADEHDVALLHADLHYGNILASDRAGWLLIDPKGVVGPPMFDVGYLVSRPMPSARGNLSLRDAIGRRLAFLPEALGLDRERVAAYAYVAATLSFAWAVEDGDASRDRFAEAMTILRTRPGGRRLRGGAA